MVIGESAATVALVAVNVALVLPAATVTVAGVVSAVVFELESETAAPPVAAFPFSVTVPMRFDPPTTDG